MNRVLKYAWYQLIVILVALAWAGVSVWAILRWWQGTEFSVLIPLVPLALVHFYRIFFPLKAGEIAFDERDEAIMNRATKISFTVFWCMFILSCVIPLIIIGNGSIHVMYLGLLLLAAGVVFRITWSIAVILQYGRTGSDNKVSEVLEGGAA